MFNTNCVHLLMCILGVFIIIIIIMLVKYSVLECSLILGLHGGEVFSIRECLLIMAYRVDKVFVLESVY